MTTLGNRLYGRITAGKLALFKQGELVELTYGSFDLMATLIMQNPDGVKIPVCSPIGLRPDRTVITSTREYSKEELVQQYQLLASHHLAINATVRIVTIMEALLSDIVRAIILQYPRKLGSKRTIAMQEVIEATTIEDMRLRATDGLLNDLSYKSPKEFAASVEELLSVNLLECPSFHKYIEIKATRDIHLHNDGIANEVYARKASSHGRAPQGHPLPIDVRYFLESYETCLQFAEWLERALLEKWPSTDAEMQAAQMDLPMALPEISSSSEIQTAELSPLIPPRVASPEDKA